jgi:hypothetical protein
VRRKVMIQKTVFMRNYSRCIRKFCQEILTQNWGEDIFKPTAGKESLHSNNNGVRTVNFATSKNLVLKDMMLQH